MSQNIVSPLFAAARDGKADLMAVLLDHSYDVNKQEANGWTPVASAALGGHYDCLAMLAKKGALMDICTDNGRSPLYHACRNGHFECAEFLINKGANMNRRNDKGVSPLSAAAQRGHAECVELLAQHGADMDLPDYEGRTPLFLAARECHLQCVITLIEYGADPNMGDNNDCSPAFVATKHGFLEVLAVILQNGGDVNAVTREGWSLAFVAAMQGHTACLDFLLASGIDIEQYIQSSIQMEHLVTASDFSRNFAATRLQRCFRSCRQRWATRELVLEKQRAALCAQLARQERIHRVVVRAQARFRGLLVRRMLREAHDYYTQFVVAEHEALEAETQRVAATHIQAVFRGVYVRAVLRKAFEGFVAEAEAAAEAECLEEEQQRFLQAQVAELEAVRLAEVARLAAEAEAARKEHERAERERLAAEAAAAERARLQDVLRSAAETERQKQDQARQAALEREERNRNAARTERATLEEVEATYAQLMRQEAEEELEGRFPLEQRQRLLLAEMTDLMGLQEELDRRRSEAAAYEAGRARQEELLLQASKVKRTREALVRKAEAANESVSFRTRLQLLAEEAGVAEAMQADVVKFTNAAAAQEQKRLEIAQRLVAVSEQRVSMLEAGIEAHRPGAVPLFISPCKTVAGHTPDAHTSDHIYLFAVRKLQAQYRGYRMRKRWRQLVKEAVKANVGPSNQLNVAGFIQ